MSQKRGKNINSVSAFFMKKLCTNALEINYEMPEKTFVCKNEPWFHDVMSRQVHRTLKRNNFSLQKLKSNLTLDTN